jgi:3-hydroxyacyl-CoA dehydrogenase
MTGRVTLERRTEIGLILVDHPPVNAMTSELRDRLDVVVREALADPEIGGMVIGGANDTYIAGGDIRQFGKPVSGISLRDVLARLEDGPKPAVCAINGPALGGGMEVALGCHYRVASPESIFGLPEISLGIFPAGGGTLRTPRLIGLEAALDMLVSAESIDAAWALEIGLIDEIAEGDVLGAALAAARRLVSTGAPLRRVGALPIRSLEDPYKVIARYRTKAARRWRGYKAPQVMLDSVEQNVRDGIVVASAGDRARYASLIADPQTVALRHLFLAERAVWKVPGVPKQTPPRPVASVGIVGAGTMGLGIAANCIIAGLPVRITDTNEGVRNAAAGRIAALLRAKPAAAHLDRLLNVVATLEEAAQADLVIEAVFETMAAKAPIFRALDRACWPGAVIATNSSGLDVDALAALTGRPQDVVGLHFFAPAQVMRLLEVVRGRETAPDVIATALWLARRLGKIAATVGNCPMFAANRTRALMQREVNAMVEEGAPPRQIDGAMTGFGLAMGFLRVGDLSGLDIGYAARRENPVYHGPGFRRPALADRLVEAGRLGQKTGKGWYRYRDGRTAEDDPEVERIAAQYRSDMKIETRSVGDDEIMQRGLYAAINEGARLLEAGLVTRASDIDVMWCAGFGFPRWRGGIMHHADVVGLPKVAAAIEGFERTLGGHWQIAPLLKRLAAEGKTFSAWDME